MNRLKKELKKKGIIFDVGIFDPYQESEELCFFNSEYIVTLWSCDVLAPKFRIYNARTFELIGEQNRMPNDIWFMQSNKWESQVY